MKHLKEYKLFESEQDIPFVTINEFWELMKDTRNYGMFRNEKTMDLIDHFVGDGFHAKAKERVDKILKVIREVDIHDLKLRLADIEYDTDIHCDSIVPCVGSATSAIVKRDWNDTETNLLAHMVIDAMQPAIGEIRITRNNYHILRQTKEQLLVTDKRYQCVNFFKQKEIEERTKPIIGDYSWKKLTEYDPFDIIEKNFNPMIFARFGEDPFNIYGGKQTFSRLTLENKLRENLQAITNNLDVKDVIFDTTPKSQLEEWEKTHPRTDSQSHEYSFKIILDI